MLTLLGFIDVETSRSRAGLQEGGPLQVSATFE
jgi:hypothetical protein